jgi:hypothetical protein
VEYRIQRCTRTTALQRSVVITGYSQTID